MLSRLGADLYLIQLLGLTREDLCQHRDEARRGDRRAVPGAVRPSAGINTTDEDVQRLLAAVARVAADCARRRRTSSGDAGGANQGSGESAGGSAMRRGPGGQ